MCKFSLYMIVLHQHGKYGDGKKLVIRGLWHKRKCATESFPRVHATHKTDGHTRTKEDFFFSTGKRWFIFTDHPALSISRCLRLEPWWRVVLQSADILSPRWIMLSTNIFFFCAFAMYEVPENLRAGCADMVVAKNTWVGWTWPGGVGECGRSAAQKGSDRFDNTKQNFQSLYESFKRWGDEVLPRQGSQETHKEGQASIR